MSDAPEIIWASTGLYHDYVTDWTEGEWFLNDEFGTQYRLASLPATNAQIKANPKVQAMVKALRGLISYSEMGDFPTNDPVQTALDALSALEADT